MAQPRLDSLWNAWEDESKSDTARLNALQTYVWQGYLFSKPDSAFYFADMLYDFAEARDLKGHMSSAINIKGVASSITSDNEAALEYFQQCLTLNKEAHDSSDIASSYNNIGLIYKIMGQYKEAIEMHQKGFKMAKAVNDQKISSVSLLNIGVIHYSQSDFPNALDYFLQALEVQEQIDDKRAMAACLNNIGSIYRQTEQLDKALECWERSIVMREAIGDLSGKASSLNNLGLTVLDMGNDSLAFEYLTQSLKLHEQIGDLRGLGQAYNNLGLYYNRQNNFNKAMEYYQQGLTLKEEVGDRKGLSNGWHNLGSVYKNKGDYKTAIEYGLRSLELAKELNTLQTINDAAGLLYGAYKSTGQSKKALEMYELHIQIRDSIDSEENQKTLIRHELQYAYDKQHLADSLAFVQQQEFDALEHQAELEREAKQRYMLYGGIGVLVLLGGMIFIGYQRKRKDNEIISIQKQEVELQKELVEEKNNEILDSITYAKRIQEAILPPNRLVKEWLPNSFVLYQPKDIVAGDFYWLESIDDTIIFAAADCTGHGVPGAMVSVVCHNAMNRAVREFGLHEPGAILDKTRELVVEQFEKSNKEVKDGMDIALCTLKGTTLQYAGAYNPLWITRNGEILETKANKQPVGKVEAPEPFTTHTVALEPGDAVYIFSDGYVDQFGGEKGKKFKVAQFRHLLLSIQDKDMDAQRTIIHQTFTTWQGDLEQVDDVCVIGVRI